MGYVKAQIPARQDLPPPPPRHTSSAMRPRPHRSPRPSRGGHQSVWLYGRHPLLAALANPDRRLERLLAARDVADRHAPPVAGRSAPADTGVLAKAASGALEIVPLVRTVNLSRALDQLKEAAFWLYGLDEGGDVRIGDLDLGGRACIALGAEGEGLRRLTAEKCDRLVTIPTEAKLASLNVSNAAAIAAYEWKRRRAS